MKPVLEEKIDLWYWQKTSALELFIFILKSLDLTKVTNTFLELQGGNASKV